MKKILSVQHQTLHVMLDRINQVISSPDIDAIHDAPYPNFAEYILIASKKIRGNEPIVVLSERNPQDWAERRIQHQTDVACRGYDVIGTNLYQCLQLAIQAGLGCKRINTIFYQFNELAVAGRGDATNVTTIIGKGFELYQNKMREVSAYHTICLNGILGLTSRSLQKRLAMQSKVYMSVVVGI